MSLITQIGISGLSGTWSNIYNKYVKSITGPTGQSSGEGETGPTGPSGNNTKGATGIDGNTGIIGATGPPSIKVNNIYGSMGATSGSITSTTDVIVTTTVGELNGVSFASNTLTINIAGYYKIKLIGAGSLPANNNSPNILTMSVYIGGVLDKSCSDGSYDNDNTGLVTASLIYTRFLNTGNQLTVRAKSTANTFTISTVSFSVTNLTQLNGPTGNTGLSVTGKDGSFFNTGPTGPTGLSTTGPTGIPGYLLNTGPTGSGTNIVTFTNSTNISIIKEQTGPNIVLKGITGGNYINVSKINNDVVLAVPKLIEGTVSITQTKTTQLQSQVISIPGINNILSVVVTPVINSESLKYRFNNIFVSNISGNNFTINSKMKYNFVGITSITDDQRPLVLANNKIIKYVQVTGGETITLTKSSIDNGNYVEYARSTIVGSKVSLNRGVLIDRKPFIFTHHFSTLNIYFQKCSTIDGKGQWTLTLIDTLAPYGAGPFFYNNNRMLDHSIPCYIVMKGVELRLDIVISSNSFGTGTWTLTTIDSTGINASIGRPDLLVLKNRLPIIFYSKAVGFSATINTLPDGSGTWTIYSGIYGSAIRLPKSILLKGDLPAVCGGNITAGPIYYGYNTQSDALGTWNFSITGLTGLVSYFMLNNEKKPMIIYSNNNITYVAVNTNILGTGTWNQIASFPFTTTINTYDTPTEGIIMRETSTIYKNATFGEFVDDETLTVHYKAIAN